MKSTFRILLMTILLASAQQGFSQQARGLDTMRRYYNSLLTSASKSDSALLTAKMYELLKTKDEQNWITAGNFFYMLNKALVTDSINRVLKTAFPDGITVRNAATDTIYKEKSAVKKEALYKAWINKYPPAKFGEDRIQYDYVRNSVAGAYAEEDNVKKAIEYANMIETPVWKGEGWAGPATHLQRKGHLAEAAMLFKKARDNSYKYMTTNKADNGAGFAATGFVGYSSSLADILIQQKKYAEALPYIREAHDSSKTVRGYVNSNYAKVLTALGKEKEAFDLLNEAVKEGQATQEMKGQMKTLYVKVKGSEAGYEEYAASLNKILAENTRKVLVKQMIKKQAPQFQLKDLEGNSVSLADLKGKTVVIDFWATWCGPCKKSFPAMKQAVARYKNDPDVKFLFIHTWEREDAKAAIADAGKYIADNSYPFTVLMDLKNNTTGKNSVVESFEIDAIPTKFVVDKEGNIRFKFTGFSGGEDAAVEEVAAMIDLANTK